nr:hypothetical protein StreXyl84_31150 [Streptomyces sp. Xyl84]
MKTAGNRQCAARLYAGMMAPGEHYGRFPVPGPGSAGPRREPYGGEGGFTYAAVTAAGGPRGGGRPGPHRQDGRPRPAAPGTGTGTGTGLRTREPAPAPEPLFGLRSSCFVRGTDAGTGRRTGDGHPNRPPYPRTYTGTGGSGGGRGNGRGKRRARSRNRDRRPGVDS